MEKTLHHLQLCYFLPLAAALLLIILFETHLLPDGSLYGVGGEQVEFIVVTVMELLTLCTIPLSLWLFRWAKIRNTLHDEIHTTIEQKAVFLRRYGTLRITLLMVPLLLNVLFYYLFMKAAFGYMAIITALASIFILPTATRCASETTGNNTPKA